MPAPILTRNKPAECKRAMIPLFLGLFCIVEEEDEEMGSSFDSPGKGSLSFSALVSEETWGAPASMLGVRDEVGAEPFLSAMVVEGEGEGQNAKRPKSHPMSCHRGSMRTLECLSLRQYPAPLPCRAPVPSANTR